MIYAGIAVGCPALGFWAGMIVIACFAAGARADEAVEEWHGHSVPMHTHHS